MKASARNALIASIVGMATPAFAASGAENEGSGILLVLFLGFGALIISFQLIPSVLLFLSMVKGLVAKPLKESPALANKKS